MSMNSFAFTTLLAYFIIGGLAFGYGTMRSREPKAEQTKQERVAKQEAWNKAARAAIVPLDEPIHIEPLYLGAEADGKTAKFNIKTRWGELNSQWKSEDCLLTSKRGGNNSAKLDLDWCRVGVQPIFGEGRRGQFTVKLTNKEGKLLGTFSIVEAGKQVKLLDASTPGYKQRLAFFEPERRVTTYRITRTGSKKEDVCAIVFLGKGYSAAEETKGADPNAVFLFPAVKFIVLHKAWLEGNDISHVMEMVKHGGAANMHN